MLSKNALLINGDEPTRDLYQTLLERSGYGVRQARTGLEALELVDRSLPDIIVQELDLGTLGGVELIRTLRRGSRTREIPILVISAWVLDADREKARLAGCSAFLAKPCKPSEMLAEVQRLLAPLE